MSWENHTEVAICFHKGAIYADTLDRQRSNTFDYPECLECEVADLTAADVGRDFASNPYLLAAVALEGIVLVYGEVGKNAILAERIRDRADALARIWRCPDDALAHPREMEVSNG